MISSGAMGRVVVVELPGGVGNPSGSSPSCIRSMIAFQIRAGYVPPCTLPPWNRPRMGICSSGKPTHTAVVR